MILYNEYGGITSVNHYDIRQEECLCLKTSKEALSIMTMLPCEQVTMKIKMPIFYSSPSFHQLVFF